MEVITLYTIDCPKCKILEEKLNKLNIKYNVVKDRDVLREKGYTVLPILEVNDKALTYFDAIKYVNSKIVEKQ